MQFELTVQSGRGGSRLDVLARGSAGEMLEFDWKTTGRGALSKKARDEMVRHANRVGVTLGQTLQSQTSVSWVDLVRPPTRAGSGGRGVAPRLS